MHWQWTWMRSQRLVPVWILASIIILIYIPLNEELLARLIHQTTASMERGNDLMCYECNTLRNGPGCNNLSIGDNSTFVSKCKGDKKMCIVKRYSYTTSTENSTSVQRIWSIERNCTNKCEPGCIVIGERTKLYACTKCCDKALCNTATGAAPPTHGGPPNHHALLPVLVAIYRAAASVR
ncbi:uncharacterized protein [Bemisia tabaci]|uniref:uncharacterized protein isoform X2 n=1 Tax=Bemisia tabaci TaxID=7038 RepID=UPI003B28458A